MPTLRVDMAPNSTRSQLIDIAGGAGVGGELGEFVTHAMDGVGPRR